jgi:hypothetical protein
MTPATFSHPSLFNCLIRTHHITSRKKLHRVRRAASQLKLKWVLVRSGGCPGIMFAESNCEDRLRDWVATVQTLRYKDFRCVAKPAPAEATTAANSGSEAMGFEATESMRDFTEKMESRGLQHWFRQRIFI